LDFDEDWSDDEPSAGPSKSQFTNLQLNGYGKNDDVYVLQAKIQEQEQEISRLRGLLSSVLTDDVPLKGKKRDDDTHYFDSYANNGAKIGSH
jgi:hypothetical protein